MPHFLEASFWNYISGIFVGIGTNLLTSESLALAKVSLIISCLILSASLFGVAAKLDLIKEDWIGAQRTLQFRRFVLKSNHTRGFQRWATAALVGLAGVLVSAIWLARKP